MDNATNENSNRDNSSNMDVESIDISQDNQSDEPANKIETGRNPDGTYKKGFSGNIEGRPKDTLKEYQRKKFKEMTDEEKDAYLKDIDVITKWKMAEGNPHQDNNTDLQGEIILKISKEISDKYEINTNTGNSSPESETI